MKASELVQELQRLIAEYGDREIDKRDAMSVLAYYSGELASRMIMRCPHGNRPEDCFTCKSVPFTFEKPMGAVDKIQKQEPPPFACPHRRIGEGECYDCGLARKKLDRIRTQREQHIDFDRLERIRKSREWSDEDETAYQRKHALANQVREGLGLPPIQKRRVKKSRPANESK